MDARAGVALFVGGSDGGHLSRATRLVLADTPYLRSGFGWGMYAGGAVLVLLVLATHTARQRSRRAGTVPPGQGPDA